MPVELDPLIDAFIYSTVVSSLDKMGINPLLVVRQAARIMAPTIGAAIQQFTGKRVPSTLEEHCKISEELFRPNQTADPDKSKIFPSNGFINMKVVDCAYLTMANLGKSLGYKACPLCIQAFLESALTTAVNVAEIENFQVEHCGDTCNIKIKLMEK